MPVAITSRTFRPDPMTIYSFAVLMGHDVQGWFSECDGLSVEREVKSHAEGGVNYYEHQLPGRVKQSRITLKRGLSGPKLWNWFEEGLYNAQVERRNVTITLFSANLLSTKSWHLTDAFPVKWSGPSFDTAKTEVSIEKLELVHHGLRMFSLF